jgi:hypothetical protein
MLNLTLRHNRDFFLLPFRSLNALTTKTENTPSLQFVSTSKRDRYCPLLYSKCNLKVSPKNGILQSVFFQDITAAGQKTFPFTSSKWRFVNGGTTTSASGKGEVTIVPSLL